MVRDKYIQIRLSADEKTDIESRAGSINTSAFLRQLALKQPIPQPNSKPTIVIHSADPELVRHVAWIGNNMNQIAKHLNSGNSVDNSILLQLIEIQSALDIELKRIMES